MQTSLYLSVSGRIMSLPHQGVLGSSHLPQHRGLPVSVIGGTAAEKYAAERMCSWFWQQRIICLFWIRRKNSSPGTGRPCSAKGALASLAAVWTDGRDEGWLWREGAHRPQQSHSLCSRVSHVLHGSIQGRRHWKVSISDALVYKKHINLWW